MDKIKVTRQEYENLIAAEITRLKEEEKNMKSNNAFKRAINTDRAYRSLGTLGGG